MTSDQEIVLPLVSDPSEEKFRSSLGHKVYQHDVSGFTIILRQTYLVHGKWTEQSEMTDFASLLVFRLELHSKHPRQKRRFRDLHASFTFKHESSTSAEDQPTVRSFEPGQSGAITLRTTPITRSREVTVGGEAKLSGPCVANASTGVTYENKNTKAYEQRDGVRISAVAKGSSPKSESLDWSGEDRVEWFISENESQMEIPDACGLAILVKRPSRGKFKVLLDVKATVDFWYQVRSITERFRGTQAGSLLYDPAIQGVCPESADPENLGKLEDGLNLSKLSFSHLPEEVMPVLAYPEHNEYQ